MNVARQRGAAGPAFTAVRLWRDLEERGFAGGYSAARRRVRELRPPRPAGFQVHFKTPPGEQAQVDFARIDVEFVDEPGVKHIIWLLSMVLGYSRPDLGTLRCQQTVPRPHLRTWRSLTVAAAPFSPGSKASANRCQYACRRVNDGYGLLGLALPEWIFGTLIG